MKKTVLSLLLLALLLTGCSTSDSKDTDLQTSNNTNSSIENSSNNSKEKDTNSQSKNKDTSSKDNNTKSKNDASNKKIIEEVKNYILNGQKDKPEASKINWSKRFLEKVDLNTLYKQYISNGGKSNSVEKFAEYITKNAPIQNNWQQMFESDFSNSYEEKITKIEPLEGDLYQVYVVIDGKTVPYVVVSSRTGYFHG